MCFIGLTNVHSDNLNDTPENASKMNVEVTPNYSYVFDFENEFIHQETRMWMVKNWTWVFYYCGAYMLVIFGGQYYMQNRPK